MIGREHCPFSIDGIANPRPQAIISTIKNSFFARSLRSVKIMERSFILVQLVTKQAIAAGARPVNKKSLLELMAMVMVIAATPSLKY